jgi:hypothetical protein
MFGFGVLKKKKINNYKMKEGTKKRYYNFLNELKDSIEKNPNVTLSNIVNKHNVSKNLVPILKRINAIKETPTGLIWTAGDVNDDLILLLSENNNMERKKLKDRRIKEGLFYRRKQVKAYKPKRRKYRNSKSILKPRKIINFKIFGFDIVIKFPYKSKYKYKF